MKILVTGASGFIGRAVCAHFVGQGIPVVGAIRRLVGNPLAGVEYRLVGNLSSHTDWAGALNGVEIVVHCAARVHVMKEFQNATQLYDDVNVGGTLRLGEEAARAGVRRLVFLSSIKVNGERTSRCFSETDSPAPLDPYAKSKLEAERALFALMRTSPLEVVAVRPPLVYGPGVQANFLQLLRIIYRGVPLPLARIRNRRSFLYVENLASAIYACAVRPAAAGEVFLVGDGTDLSTPELIRALANALGRRSLLINVPLPLLRIFAMLLGRSAALSRLTDSLCVNADKIREVLDWSPPFTMSEGFARTAAWYLAR